jgi:HPt (histidine-containing phosphotransfer) domain-containing protein
LDRAALQNLMSMLGGEFEYLEELIDSFLEDGPKLLEELQRYLADGDAAGVRRVAHSLKSNGADFGANGFSDLCRLLEELAKTGELDGAEALTAEIIAEYANVEGALQALRLEGRIPA